MTYQSAAVLAGSISYPLSALSAYKFVHIRHTGYVYSSGSVLGAVSTDNLVIYIKIDTEVAASATISPGGSFILPVGAGIDFSTNDIGYKSAGTSTIAVEVMATT